MVTTGPSTGIMSLPRGVRTSSIKEPFNPVSGAPTCVWRHLTTPFSHHHKIFSMFDWLISNPGTLTRRWAFGPILHPQPVLYRSRVLIWPLKKAGFPKNPDLYRVFCRSFAHGLAKGLQQDRQRFNGQSHWNHLRIWLSRSLASTLACLGIATSPNQQFNPQYRVYSIIVNNFIFA